MYYKNIQVPVQPPCASVWYSLLYGYYNSLKHCLGIWYLLSYFKHDLVKLVNFGVLRRINISSYSARIIYPTLLRRLYVALCLKTLMKSLTFLNLKAEIISFSREYFIFPSSFRALKHACLFVESDSPFVPNLAIPCFWLMKLKSVSFRICELFRSFFDFLFFSVSRENIILKLADAMIAN